jgi:FdhD protein
LDQKEERQVVTVTSGQARERTDWLAIERPLTIFVNGRQYITLLSSGNHLEELSVGYAFNQGLLASKDDIRSLSAYGEKVVLDLMVNPKSRLNCPKKLKAGIKLSPSQITSLMGEFSMASTLFQETGAVHSAALARETILVFGEDIARHNTIDILAGYIILEELNPASLCLLTSGRVSSSVVSKCHGMGIGLLISRSAPTSLAVEMAEEVGITLVGFAREQRFNIYCNPWRVEI